MKGKLPCNLKRQTPTSLEFRERVKGELNSVRDKDYIQVGGLVNSFTNFFLVAKTWKVEEGVK